MTGDERAQGAGRGGSLRGTAGNGSDAALDKSVDRLGGMSAQVAQPG